MKCNGCGIDVCEITVCRVCGCLFCSNCAPNGVCCFCQGGKE